MILGWLVGRFATPVDLPPHGYYIWTMVTTNNQQFCYTNHILTMVFVVKLYKR